MTPCQKVVAMSAFGSFDGALDVLNTVVKEVRINTAWGPPMVLDSPFSPSPPGTPTPGSWLKPEIVLVLREGYGGAQSYAPFGKPGSSKWPIVLTGITVLAALTIFGGVSFGRNLRRR